MKHLFATCPAKEFDEAFETLEHVTNGTDAAAIDRGQYTVFLKHDGCCSKQQFGTSVQASLRYRELTRDIMQHERGAA